MQTHVMNHAEIARYAPSVFAETARADRSGKYAFIPTSQVLGALEAEGWQVRDANQTRIRKGPKEYAKHLLRLAHPSIPPVLEGLHPELILVNSHDGSSSYTLMAGFFRLACSNGLIVRDGNLGEVRVRHTGDVVRDVLEGSARIMADVPELTRQVREFSAIDLSDSERLIYAESALRSRYGVGESGQNLAPITAESVLSVRRSEDRKRDLWHTFNVVQENIMKGGQRGRTETGKRTRTRSIASVNASVDVNRALWFLTSEMAKLKTAKTA